MLAAYLVGVAQTATRMAVDYAMQREQFGQPRWIGGHQSADGPRLASGGAGGAEASQ